MLFRSDNDGDGVADAMDSDCGGAEDAEGATSTAGDCTDGIDDDGDGWIDADDPDCASGTAEAGYGTASCNDGADNDGDGVADAMDSDCGGAEDAE